MFFPILNSCINLALAKETSLENTLDKLSGKMLSYVQKYHNEEFSRVEEKLELNEEELELVKVKAESKIKVQAGIRWQVFKRDNWRCLSCGRSADENVILHIDHIIPRSKGGKDELNNYQTLCETCNIGKSNKDDTNLRNR